MRVVVDARALASGRGVARYTRRMLEAAAAAGVHDWHAVVPAGADPVAGFPAGVTVHRSALPSRVLHGLGGLTGRPRLDVIAGGADVVWLPTVAPVAVSRSTPYVLTVHDLSFLVRPGDFTPYERAWHRAARVGRLVRRARAVVCDTGAVAADVAARWPRAATGVRVVAPGVDRPGPPALLPGLPDRYLLFVGALEPRKAPDVLAAAFAAARRDGLDADLVVAGTGREDDILRVPGVHHVGQADDPQLDALYAGALALVMPSHLEGFGLPPLEAALHGTPSIVSALPVFEQTIGAGALHVPAGDAGALARAMREVADDPALRRRLAQAGAQAAGPLTWSAAAAGLTAVLEQAAR